MKKPDFRKLYSLLRGFLREHEASYSVKLNTHSLQTVRAALESLQQQEDQFAQFVIKKQGEIDSMPEGILKLRMQEHLDKVTEQTHGHFAKLMDKYY